MARAIKARMDTLGLNQKRLAIEAGLNETYVRDILKGKSKNPKYDQLSRLARALNCRAEDLTRSAEKAASGELGISNPERDSETVYESEDIVFVRLWKLLSRDVRARILHDILAERALQTGSTKRKQ